MTTECQNCGAPITFMQDWRDRWIILDANPEDGDRESFLEIQKGVFVSVFRHTCSDDKPKKPSAKLL